MCIRDSFKGLPLCKRRQGFGILVLGIILRLLFQRGKTSLFYLCLLYTSNRRVNGSYIDAHIYEVAERSKRGKPTAFRVVEDAPVENPFEPVGRCV